MNSVLLGVERFKNPLVTSPTVTVLQILVCSNQTLVLRFNDPEKSWYKTFTKVKLVTGKRKKETLLLKEISAKLMLTVFK